MASQKKKTTSKKPTKQVKKVNKKNKKEVKIVTTVLSLIFLIGAISYGAYYYFYIYNKDVPSIDDDKKEDNKEDKKDDESTNNKDLGEVNVASSTSWNNTFSLSSDSVFYQYDKEEIDKYYKNVDFNSDKTKIISTLFDTLKTNFKKLDYSGKNSSFKYGSTNWANYALVDRDYEASPLNEEEVTTNKWSLDCEIDLLYSNKNYSLNNDVSTFGKSIADREHVYPKSYGFNTSGSEDYKELNAGCDLHNLWAADKTGNQTAHNNRLYDDVNGSNPTKGRYDESTITYYNDNYFEPNDEDKGIIARSCLYMVIRYNEYYIDENNIENPRLSLSDDASQLSSSLAPSYTKDNVVDYGKLSTLIKWNNEHPVSEHEKTRNNLVYNLQGNRNPFIDYPNLANILFN